MLKLNLQLFGGRGSGSDDGLGGGGGDQPTNVSNEKDLISQREDGKRDEVDAVLWALRNTNESYGYQIANVTTARVSPSNVMAFYEEGSDTITFNQAYFDAKRIDAAYDRSVQGKFHPPRGSKSGVEATMSHELGHALTEQAARKSGMSFDAAAKDIVVKAAKMMKVKSSQMASAISGYASKNNAECIAEACADVYCNGNKANKGSIAVVNELNKYIGRK